MVDQLSYHIDGRQWNIWMLDPAHLSSRGIVHVTLLLKLLIQIRLVMLTHQTVSAAGCRRLNSPCQSVRSRVSSPGQRAWIQPVCPRFPSSKIVYEYLDGRGLIIGGRCSPVTFSSSRQEAEAAASINPGSVSIVLLAGGVGKRMGASIPKQYLELCGKPIATYSMETFLKLPCVGEIVVVCEEEWRQVFQDCYARLGETVPLKFAFPGAERQDSVFSGLQKISPQAELVAIHDSARPLVTTKDTMACIMDAKRVGAAVLGVPVKPTIKEASPDGMVVKTLQRSLLWEVQTPQVIEPQMLREGFELVKRENLEVTDDVSIIEAMGNPVVITKGCYTNIKVTTPEDMAVAEGFLNDS